jgi:hypothetical protein
MPAFCPMKAWRLHGDGSGRPAALGGTHTLIPDPSPAAQEKGVAVGRDFPDEERSGARCASCCSDFTGTRAVCVTVGGEVALPQVVGSQCRKP